MMQSTSISLPSKTMPFAVMRTKPRPLVSIKVTLKRL